MNRRRLLLAILPALGLAGCVSSSLVLHVMPDGSGSAVLTSRLFESGLRAYDSMFPETAQQQVPLEQELIAPSAGELERGFGGQVRLVSTDVAKTADGIMRTTVVEFDDVRKLRLQFPPMFGLPSGVSLYTRLPGEPVITFDIKPHEDGNRLLLVRLPGGRAQSDPDPQITVLQTDSPEEAAFKRAIKGMALRLFVETEQPLLRTSAPASEGNRATILDLDLDKIINNLDETKVRRAMAPGSMQELLWQLGDMPGAVVPAEHEVFLEYEPPQTQAQTPPPAAAAPARQPPPDTEIYLAPLGIVNGRVEVGEAVDISNNPGYDNQPFFTPDGKAVLFTSVRGGGTQTDIYRYDIASHEVLQVTSTPESEYSPTVTPLGALSVVRVELDKAGTQRLWEFTLEGRNPHVLLDNVKPVGYHAWADDHTLALYILGTGASPATLQLADTRTGTARVVASDVGRSIQRIPGSSQISFVQRERRGDRTVLIVKALDPGTGASVELTPAVEGSTDADCAWTPDGTLLMANATGLYGWSRGQTGWKEITSLERLSLKGVTRLAVSLKGDNLALVALPRQSR